MTRLDIFRVESRLDPTLLDTNSVVFSPSQVAQSLCEAEDPYAFVAEPRSYAELGNIDSILKSSGASELIICHVSFEVWGKSLQNENQTLDKSSIKERKLMYPCGKLGYVGKWQPCHDLQKRRSESADQHNNRLKKMNTRTSVVNSKSSGQHALDRPK